MEIPLEDELGAFEELGPDRVEKREESENPSVI